MNKKVILLILDGWGIEGPSQGNALYKANTPTIDDIERNYFAASLQASGIAVGLQWGQEGNSEVGHLNLGAGRIIYQYLPRIMTDIRDGSFFKNKALVGATDFVKRNNSTLHLMGLLSSGSVHSYIDHFYSLLQLAKQQGISNVAVHMFTDGKDSSPNEAATLIQNLNERFKMQQVGKIATVMGRSYAMDRNHHWDLTQQAYETLTQGKGNAIDDPSKYIKDSYAKGKTDFDIEPAVVYENDQPVGQIKQGDAVVFFNFREDSARQLTQAFVNSPSDFAHFPRQKIPNLYFAAMTEYQKGLPIEVAFPPPKIANPLSKIIADAGLKQLHIAETEKYAHITYFFNGEHEQPYPQEDRVVLTSKGTPHYDQYPAMQAYEITEKFFENFEKYDFFVINFANADMLGHTGNFQATVSGAEAIDANLSGILETAKKTNATVVITADHGNAEQMVHPKTGRVITKHSINPVPLYIVGQEFKVRNSKLLFEQKATGVLADVAPTILKLFGIAQPKDMNGRPVF